MEKMGKILSLFIAAAYLIFADVALGSEMFFKILIFLVFPLACIWFGSEIGGFVGFSGLGRPAITKTSTSGLIRFMGWVFLLLPLLFIIIFVF